MAAPVAAQTPGGTPFFSALSVNNITIDPRLSQFGNCTWDATHDVAPCIQSAINYAISLPTGGNVVLPAGRYGIAATINNTTSNVSLIAPGKGGDANHSSGSIITYGTQLIWIGAAGGTMVRWAPIADPANQAMAGSNLEGMLLDANQIANTGLYMAALRDSVINVAIREPAGSGVIADTVVIGEQNNVQRNRISLYVIDRLGPGPMWDIVATGNTGTIHGNFSQNEVLYFMGVGGASNADCLHFQHGDSNHFVFFRCDRGAGLGKKIVLYGSSDNNAPIGANNNIFDWVTGGSGAIEAKGTTSFTNPSVGNIIVNDTGNGGLQPVIETGATLTWQDTMTLAWTNWNGNLVSIADAAPGINNIIAHRGGESLAVGGGYALGIYPNSGLWHYRFQAFSGPVTGQSNVTVDSTAGAGTWEWKFPSQAMRFGSTIAVGGTGEIDQTTLGKGVLILRDAVGAPTANPTDGVILWSANGVINARDSKGNIYTLAAAGGNKTLFASGNSIGNVDTNENILKTYTLPANTLANNGDVIHITAGGTMGATTDSKTVRLRWGGIGGSVLANPSGAVAGAVTWHSEAWIMRTAAGAQSFNSNGAVVGSGNTSGVLTANASIDETQPQDILVTGRNTTTVAAGSITCSYFHVEYKKGP
jgi:hypothetical protein